MAKNSGKGSDIATDPHVSILAHVTLPELRQKLNDADALNGFGNRFFWVCSRRSKDLPFGGALTLAGCADLTAAVHRALAFARSRELIGFTDAASAVWESVYPQLNKPLDGILGCIVARGPAHIRRIALIYALLDCADAVDVQHLRAALAFWSYCVDSARFIFGGADPVTAEVYAGLLAAFPGELTRDELHKALGRHCKAAELTRSLNDLKRLGVSEGRIERTSGKSRELWRICARKARLV